MGTYKKKYRLNVGTLIRNLLILILIVGCVYAFMNFFLLNQESRLFDWRSVGSADSDTAGNVKSETVTVPEPEPEPDFSASARINMAGDFLLHQGPIRAATVGTDKYDLKPFMKDIKPYLDGDINTINVDGTINAFGDNKNISSYPMFNFPKEGAEALKYAGFTAIVTANNHAFDKQWGGLKNTRKAIKKAGLTPVGTYPSQEKFDELLIEEVNGIKIGITAWTALDNGMSGVIGEHLPYAMRQFNQDNTDDVPRMLAEVDRLREAGAEAVLMPLHWGAEYRDEPSDMQRKIAEELMDGGVDIIIGGHSHCVQPIEVKEVNRNGRAQKALCIYSLGNFFADQTGLNPPTPKTQYGMLVQATVERDKEGNIDLGEMRYMPTLCNRDSTRNANNSSQGYGYALIPAGKYAKMDKQPDNISGEVWNNSKKAWKHVKKVVGKDIKVYSGKDK